MKKFFIIMLILFSIANVMLNIKYKYPNIRKNSQILEDEAITSEDVTVLIINHSYTISFGQSLKGWFAEHLKEELGIEVQQAEYPATGGGLWDCNEDLCYFSTPEGYYDAVRKGQLINLEGDIRKQQQIYQRYQKVIEQMKTDTYEHTGKRGVFGFPMHMHSFDAAWLEGNCLAIPTYASHPEQAMELITYSATDDGIMNIAFGPEGQMWEKGNGRYVLLQDLRNENSSRKFVMTREGLEEYVSATVYMELVGNEQLGRELLAMTAVNRRDDL